MKRKFWFYDCAVCGCHFPIWWVSAEEWEAGGFGDKAVCKTCFEAKVSHPRCFTLDEYMDNAAPDLEEITDMWLDGHPGEDRSIAERAAVDIMAGMYDGLEKIWDS